MTSIKRTTIYSLILFAALLTAFNFRFLITNLKFSLSTRPSANSNPISVTENDDYGPYLLPIAEAKETPAPTPGAGIVEAENIGPSYWLEIPSLGITAPIIMEQSSNLNVIYKRLEKGVVHYSPSPELGELGTSVILGHSSAYPWYRGSYGSVFALISKLNAGDRINIYGNSKTLNYKVSKSLVFSPFSTDEELLSGFEQSNDSSIILMSCWPVGTNYKRLAVRADLETIN